MSKLNNQNSIRDQLHSITRLIQWFTINYKTNYIQLQDQLQSITRLIQWFTINCKTNYYQLQWFTMICMQLRNQYNDLQSITRPFTRYVQWFTTNYNPITITITMISSQFRSDYIQLQLTRVSFTIINNQLQWLLWPFTSIYNSYYNQIQLLLQLFTIGLTTNYNNIVIKDLELCTMAYRHLPIDC